MITKKLEYACPKCGNTETEIADTKIDDARATYYMWCFKCKTCWAEYCQLKYVGYRYDGITYIEDGARG